MSALAEALVAAQRRAIGALEKAYVAGAFEDDRMREQLDAIGCNDAVDHDHLIHALDVLRTYGGPLPAANGEPATKKPEPATDAQLSLIARLVKEKNAAAPDLPLTKLAAHEVIDTLKAGTYDASKWTVPF